MEAHAVPQAVAASVKRKRQVNFSEKLIEDVVTDVRHIGASAAAHKANKGLQAAEHIKEETVRKWLWRWRKEGNFWTKQT